MKTGTNTQAQPSTATLTGHAGKLKIQLVHGVVAGRTRLSINIIYRNKTVKNALESQLCEMAGIQHAQANILTATILILHEKHLSSAAILEQVRAMFGQAASAATTAATYHPKVTSLDTRRRKINGQAGATEAIPWHLLPGEQILTRLATTLKQGLSRQAVEERLRHYGLNQLQEAKARTELEMLLEQFMSVPVGLLGASAAVSLLTGGLADAVAILVVVLINAGIGFATERQAEKTISALSKVTPGAALVIREGILASIPITEVTPGDILVLQPGHFVAADARLLQADHLTIDESALTGESLPVKKSTAYSPAPDTPLSERHNMVYMGTLVTGGMGVAVVVGIGYDTELGQIQRLVGEAHPPETPMQQQLQQMGTQLALISGGVCAVVFGVGLLRGQGFLQMLKGAISLAVAAVPEGLPAVATTTLALGIRNMRKQQVAIRHLDAVETLGSVQVFCLDKTGTLTLNRMSVVAVNLVFAHIKLDNRQFRKDEEVIEPVSHTELARLLEIVSLCSDVEFNGPHSSNELNGTPTENALVDAALQAGLDVQTLRLEYPRRKAQYRSEHRPYMITVHDTPEDDCLLAIKGSPIELLSMCVAYQWHGELRPLDDEIREQILADNSEMAARALRILGVAYRRTDTADGEMEQDLVWLGLIGMADPLRSGMPEFMHTLHQAGVHTVMITGDQSATAYNIGKELNLSNGEPLQILDSTKLDKLDPQLLAGLVSRVHVFARVSPAHKLRIVQAIQASGKVVAMTGDGINDGPALKAADIGVAMGGAQNDVARSVADVVLEDDNLQTMVTAVRQGRTIYNNIRKTIHYLLSTNLSEIEIMLLSVGFGLGQPLSAMQLLWINLITDIFPGLALAMEQAEPDIMQRQPRASEEKIINRKDLLRMARESAIITGGSLASFLYARGRYGPGPVANSHAFNSLVLAQLFHAISCRSDTHSIFSSGRLPGNPALTWAIGASVAIQALAMLVPSLRKLLGVTPLSVLDGLVITAGAGVPMLINEAIKHVNAELNSVTNKTQTSTTPAQASEAYET